ncbi:hypothetical protein [Paenarthrobacter sp. NPDC018779]
MVDVIQYWQSPFHVDKYVLRVAADAFFGGNAIAFVEFLSPFRRFYNSA